MTQTTATRQQLTVRTRTRTQALADGALVATDPYLARRSRWRYPMAYTTAVHAAVVAWSEETDKAKGVRTTQSQAEREWEMLSMLRLAWNRVGPWQDRLDFVVYAVPPTGTATRPAYTALVVHIGPGDTPEPVITIMLPGEE